MFQKVLLPTFFTLLVLGFWFSPEFTEISAGIAIFLFGMISLEKGFKTFAGGVMENLLRKSTSSLWKSISFGMVTTGIMQSSSLVSVITISFLGAGLISLSAGIGIVFGANLGTTTSAWLIAAFGLKVKISAYAMPMLVFGVIFALQKHKTLQAIGYVLSGIGFLFLGIHFMKEGFDAFKETIDLTQYAVSGYLGVLLYAVIGIIATVIMQSSSTTLVLIITALASGQIVYENALALAIGANVGTTITAIIASVSSNAQGRRLALAHVIFNFFTAAIAIIFIYQFADLVNIISDGFGIAANNYTLKLAIFHTLFNLLGVVLMIPQIPRLEKFLKKRIKRKKTTFDKPKYLLQTTPEYPDAAIAILRKETRHLYNNARSIILLTIGIPKKELNADITLKDLSGRFKKIRKIDVKAAYIKKIKGIYSEIIAYISRSDFTWESVQSGDLHWLRDANLSIGEAIQNLQNFQKNLLLYSSGKNKHTSLEYHNLRLCIARLINKLDELKNEKENDLKILSLDNIKANVKEEYSEQQIILTNLIRQKKITPVMGTSLMNDSNLVHKILNDLIRVAETVFVSHHRKITKAQRSISLDDAEIQQILTKD